MCMLQTWKRNLTIYSYNSGFVLLIFFLLFFMLKTSTNSKILLKLSTPTWLKIKSVNFLNQCDVLNFFDQQILLVFFPFVLESKTTSSFLNEHTR